MDQWSAMASFHLEGITELLCRGYGELDTALGWGISVALSLSLLVSFLFVRMVGFGWLSL